LTNFFRTVRITDIVAIHAYHNGKRATARAHPATSCVAVSASPTAKQSTTTPVELPATTLTNHARQTDDFNPLRPYLHFKAMWWLRRGYGSSVGDVAAQLGMWWISRGCGSSVGYVAAQLGMWQLS
jgi:hypothetical protein